MNFLALECSSETLSLAASKLTQNWYFECAGGPQTSSILVPQCLEGLARLKLSMDELDAIVYARGPGSFTGLRTACSAAQGFSFAHQTLTLGVDSLLGLAHTAHRLKPAFNRVLSVLDARMGQLYVGAYSFTSGFWEVHQAPQLIDPPEALLPKAWTLENPTAPFLLVCNTERPTQMELMQTLKGQPQNFEFVLMSPRADALIDLASIHFTHPSLSERLGFQTGLPTPLYVRERVAQTTKERSAAPTQLVTPTR